MDNRSCFDLAERLTHAVAAQEKKLVGSFGLQPVHLRALRYLARANAHSDTPIAAAEYLGLTKGTVSQTLLVLRRRGYLRKDASGKDRRRAHLRVTSKGTRLLGELDSMDLFSATTRREVELRRRWASGLEDLLLKCAKHHRLRTFGVCRTCGHHHRELGGKRRCGRIGESVSATAALKICRHHVVAE